MPRIPAYLNLPRTAYELRQRDEAGISRVILDGVIDGAPELQHGHSVDVTQFPIGKETYVSDHAIVRPFTLRGRFIVTNSTSLSGKVRTIQSLENAWTSIRSVFISRQTFDVVTSLAAYPDMIFTNLSREESPGTGTSLIIDFAMQQVQRVEIEVTRSGESSDSGIEPQGDGSSNGGTLNRGRQPLVNVIQDSRDVDSRLSGTISLANVIHQRFLTTFPSSPILNSTILINYNATNAMWTIDMMNAGNAQVLANARLLNGTNIPLRLGNESYGQLIVHSQVAGDPGAPSGNSPWGNEHSLHWNLD